MYHGTWLRIKIGGEYIPPEFIEFENEMVHYFKLLPEINNYELTKTQRESQNISEIKHEFVNENRVRFYVPGKIHTIFESTSTTTDTIFEHDYERMEATVTELTPEEIEAMEFDVIWNDQKIPMIFNVSIDHEVVQFLNKRHNLEGEKIVLEKLQETYFATIYFNGSRSKLIPIRKISADEIILYGFPALPHEVTGQRISKIDYPLESL